MTFQVGDVVTWGNGVISHVVVEVREDAVVVDSTSSGYGSLQEDGTRHIEVPLDAAFGLRLTSMPPDTGPYATHTRPS